MQSSPMSVESAEAAEILKGLGIADGPKIPITFLNLFLNNGQLAILLANMSPKFAFVDLEKSRRHKFWPAWNFRGASF